MQENAGRTGRDAAEICKESKMEYGDALRALADPNRMRIMELLSGRSYCVGVLGRILGISAPAVSQHMKILQEAGLVEAEKVGYHTHYSVNRDLLHRMGEELVTLSETVPEVCERQGMRCGENGMRKWLIGCRGRKAGCLYDIPENNT